MPDLSTMSSSRPLGLVTEGVDTTSDKGTGIAGRGEQDNRGVMYDPRIIRVNACGIEKSSLF